MEGDDTKELDEPTMDEEVQQTNIETEPSLPFHPLQLPSNDSSYSPSLLKNGEEDEEGSSRLESDRDNAGDMENLTLPSQVKEDNRYVVCSVAEVDPSQELFSNPGQQQQKAPTPSSSTTNTECPICMDSTPPALQLECGHAFCQACVTQYCEIQTILPISCPNNTCQYTLPIRFLETVLGRDELIHLITYYQARQRPIQYRVCPFCQQLLTLPQTARLTNDLRCGHCRRTFCKHHETQHLGVLCQDFRSTVNLLEGCTKPCSHCGTHLQKSSGCDHLICPSCQRDMCWNCGSHEYLTGTVTRRCSRCNVSLGVRVQCNLTKTKTQVTYIDHRYDHVHRRRLCYWLPVLLPLSVLYMALLGVVCVVSGCFVGCFRCGRCLDSPHQTFKYGLLATVTLIFFPLIAILADFGFYFSYLDELAPDRPQSEIPYLTPTTRDDLLGNNV